MLQNNKRNSVLYHTNTVKGAVSQKSLSLADLQGIIKGGGGGQGGVGGGIYLGIGLQRGQGRPHQHREIWETLRAPKARKLVSDTRPLIKETILTEYVNPSYFFVLYISELHILARLPFLMMVSQSI